MSVHRSKLKPEICSLKRGGRERAAACEEQLNKAATCRSEAVKEAEERPL